MKNHTTSSTFRFCVDSEMTFDMDLPALKNEQGGYCNMIKVKIPSYSAPQWNKAPKPKEPHLYDFRSRWRRGSLKSR